MLGRVTSPAHRLAWQGCLTEDSHLVWYGQRCGAGNSLIQWTGERALAALSARSAAGPLAWAAQLYCGGRERPASVSGALLPGRYMLPTVACMRFDNPTSPIARGAGVYAADKLTGALVPGCQAYHMDRDYARSRSLRDSVFGGCGVAPTAVT